MGMSGQFALKRGLPACVKGGREWPAEPFNNPMEMMQVILGKEAADFLFECFDQVLKILEISVRCS